MPVPKRRPGLRPRVREGLLLLGFVLLLVASALTVLVPELSKEPDDGGAARPAAAEKKP